MRGLVESKIKKSGFGEFKGSLLKVTFLKFSAGLNEFEHKMLTKDTLRYKIFRLRV